MLEKKWNGREAKQDVRASNETRRNPQGKAPTFVSTPGSRGGGSVEIEPELVSLLLHRGGGVAPAPLRARTAGFRSGTAGLSARGARPAP